MLKSLDIALIESAIIDFTSGLNILSGETGAGKSVIIDSLNFVLGAKADKTMIRYGKNECAVSAVFDLSASPQAKSALGLLEDDGDDLVITRKLSSDGKTSIRVNGEPYTLSMLKSVTSLLVDVHGQSEHYSLLKESEQLKVLDRFSGEKISAIKGEIRQTIDSLKTLEKSLNSVGGTESERAIRIDILKYQIDEIKEADIKEGEEEELISRNNTIKNVEKINESLSAANAAIKGDECAIDMINSAIHSISAIGNLDDKYFNLKERLSGVVSELSDAAATIDDFIGECDFDEAEIEEVNKRLEIIKNIKKKYGNTVEEINNFLFRAQEEYDKLINYEEERVKLTAEISRDKTILNDLYRKLSDLRKKGAEGFSKKVKEQLCDLGMKNADFYVDFKTFYETEHAPYSENGADEIEFMFSANLGEPPKSLSKIISGGEMSRFMLALKVIISDYQEISTYVFDEIDVGLSGDVARIVAEKFAKISTKTQVIAISHLAQICAMADNSLKIEKYEDGDKTYTSVKILDESEKVEEIIRIIGGENSEIAKSHARELLLSANNFKEKLA